MVSVLTNKIVLPRRYPIVERKDRTILEGGWDKVGGSMLRDKIDFMPQKGLQEQLCSCQSNLIFVFGGMSMGKTYAMLMKALYGVNKKSFSSVMISVRLADSKKGSPMYRDAVELLGKYGNCEYTSSDSPTFFWPQWNSSFRLIHSNFDASKEDEWAAFKDYAKKVQASYIAIDEATEIKTFKMFTYWFGRNRDASGMRPQMVLSFNPEHTHWTTKMLCDAGYIGDDWYFKPEMAGVTKYFYVKGNTNSPADIIWGDTAEEVAERADITLSEKDIEVGAKITDMVKSFTPLTGEPADNKILVAATKGQCLGNLHAVGGQQRAIVKGGYFGEVEAPQTDISRDMVRSLWTNPIDPDGEMYATLDVATGGKNADRCPMVIWKGQTIIAVDMFSGNPKELVDWIDFNLHKYSVPTENFCFDATGIGNYLKGYTNGLPVTANARTIPEIDTNGNPVLLEQYYNLRSQLLGKMKVMLERGDISCRIPQDTLLPYGKNGEMRKFIDIIYDEINLFTWTMRSHKIYYKTKDEYRSRFNHSPDLMDAIVLLARFFINAKPRKQKALPVPEDAYDALYEYDSYDTPMSRRWY